MSTVVDLRCPVTPRRLFGKWRSGEVLVNDENLLEFACLDCRKMMNRLGDPDVVMVLHLFNVLGQCVDTQVTRSE